MIQIISKNKVSLYIYFIFSKIREVLTLKPRKCIFQTILAVSCPTKTISILIDVSATTTGNHFKHYICIILYDE